MHPQPGRMPQLNRAAQHSVESPKKGKLEKVGQAAAQRIYAFTLVQVLELAVLFCLARVGELIAFVLLVDGGDLRLQLLHAHRRLDRGNAQRQQGNVDDDSENENRPAVIRGPVLERPAQPQKERLGEEGEIAKVHQLFQAGPVGLGRDARRSSIGANLGDYVQRLRANEETLASATGCSDSSSQNGNSLLLVRIGLVEVLGDPDLVVESCQRCMFRVVRQEDGSKILIHSARPIERSIDRSAPAHLLHRDTLYFVLVRNIDAGGSVGGGDGLVAKARGPGWIRGSWGALLRNRRLDTNFVAMAEREFLRERLVQLVA